MINIMKIAFSLCSNLKKIFFELLSIVNVQILLNGTAIANLWDGWHVQTFC